MCGSVWLFGFGNFLGTFAFWACKFGNKRELGVGLNGKSSAFRNEVGQSVLSDIS